MAHKTDIDQWNRIIGEKISQNYKHLIFSRNTKNVQWGKDYYLQ